MNQEAIYLRLPIWAQNMICSLYGWNVNRTRFGAGFRTRLKRAEERLRWSHDQLVEYRDMQLRAFVSHAVTTTRYYQELFRSIGAEPQDIQTLEDMRRLPVLTKPTVQDRYEDFLSSAVPSQARIVSHTSGTTGGGLRFAVTMDAIQEQWAIWWRYRRSHGIDLDTWCGYFAGRSVVPLSQTSPPFWRWNRPGRQIVFSGYHMSPQTLPQYVDVLRRHRPPWLHGYPSLLALLANFLMETGQRLDYTPRSITVGAESLLPQQIETIRAGLGVAPTEHYGMTEAVANASQCTRGRLHVDEDFAATSFLPMDGGDPNTVRIVGTNFTNPAVPFLQYDVGDQGELDPAGCDCGLGGRVMKAVDGRKEDYVILRNGARLGRMDHIFKDLVNIREAQIYQNTPGVVIVRVVRGANYGEADERLLQSEFRKRVGDQAEIRIQHVPQIQRTATGKLRFVVSELQQGSLDPARLAATGKALETSAGQR